MAFKRPKKTYDEAVLYEYAVGALSRRMRTVAELKRLLRNRTPDDEAGREVIEKVVARLKEQKYLNDSSYAALYSALRRDNEKFGKRRVITELKARGVHSDLIDKTVQETFSGVDELQQAREFLKRKRLKKPATDKDAARIFRALMRAGFGTGASIKVLKSWKVDDELLSALQEESQ